MATPNPRVVLLEAVQALYHHPDPEIRTNANQWLEEFQHTLEAWQVTDSVLHDSTSTLEALYFSAQTLRRKVQREFEDLPPSATLSLRDSLMTLLVKFRQGPTTVRTQLCLAMAALAVHLPGEEWGSSGVVQWLGNELGSQADALPCFLELVTVLPQEASGYNTGVRPVRSRHFQHELVASVQPAFAMLTSCLNDGMPQVREQVLQAFASWLRLSQGIPAATLASHPLVAASVAGLQSEQTFDAAVDAFVELIRYTVSGSPVDLASNMPLVQVIVPSIMALRPRFAASVKAAVAEKQASTDSTEEVNEGDEQDEEITKGMAYLFADMGEAYVDLIANGSSESLTIVDAIAEVTSHPDDNIAGMTFNFWYRLRKMLTSSDGLEQMLSAGDGAAHDVEKEKRLAIYRPKFERLVSQVSFRVMYPPKFEKWRKDELADFKMTRYAVADLLMDAAAVLGGENTLRILSQPLLQMAASHQNGGTWEWRPVEASLYCIRAIAKAIPLSENVIVPQVMTLLPQLQPQPQLLYTSSLILAALADWLGEAPTAPVLLPNLLGLLTRALSVSGETSAAAALALKHVCDACRSQLRTSLDYLLQLYREALSGPGQHNLGVEDGLQLVEGLSMVVSALPSEQLPLALEALCFPIIAPLMQLINEAQQAGSAQIISANQYIIHIDRLSNVFRYVSKPALLADFFQRIWPYLQAVFAQRADDPRTLERTCRACKYAVRFCGKSLGGMIGPILQELLERFQRQPHSCFLYLASEIIKTFGTDLAYANYLKTLIVGLFSQCISLLQTMRDFTSRPDVTDDTFLLASRCSRYCTELLVSSPISGPLFRCAVTGVTIQHREACRSILTFLQDFLELPSLPAGRPFRAVIDAVVLPCGPVATRVLIGAAICALPESRLEEVVDVLVSLSRLYGQQVVQWANESLSAIPSAVVTEGEREHFLQALSLAAGGHNVQGLTRSMEDLSGVCRRNKRVMEIVQNALQPQVTFTSTVAG